MKNPQRNLPMALIFGTLMVMGIYLLMNFVYLYILPIDEFINIYESKNGIAAVAVVNRFLGSWGSLLISCLILVATFNCSSTTILLASRLFYAMARDNMFFKKGRLYPSEIQYAFESIIFTGNLDFAFGDVRDIRPVDGYVDFCGIYFLRSNGFRRIYSA